MCLTWEIQTHWPTTKHWKLHIVWKYVLLRLFTFQSALLSGGDVIIVIGGDNKYKGEDEEEREVISRWAKRKVISQFGEEYLGGKRALSSLGTNNIERFTNKLCCFTLTQTRKDRSLNIGHLLQINNQTQNLNCRKHLQN